MSSFRALLAAAVLALAGCAPSAPAPPAVATPAGLEAVERVVDGDTFILANGERVRLLGIDAPELHAGRRGHPGPFPEPGAVEARAALAAMIEGRRVRLERHGRDRYGRTLARVYLPDGREAGAVLLERGLARPWPARGPLQDFPSPGGPGKVN